jgi:hypothetical protein
MIDGEHKDDLKVESHDPKLSKKMASLSASITAVAFGKLQPRQSLQ